MVRRIGAYLVLAVAAVMALKVGLFLVSVAFTVLCWAALGYLTYKALQVVAPRWAMAIDDVLGRPGATTAERPLP